MVENNDDRVKVWLALGPEFRELFDRLEALTGLTAPAVVRLVWMKHFRAEVKALGVDPAMVDRALEGK